MHEIRIHGRGGQGVVTAAELISSAAFAEGRHAQAFPSFGSERTGAPVVSFCRIDDAPIRVREPVIRPDVLIIGDPTLLHQVSLFEGADESALVLINSARPVERARHRRLHQPAPAGCRPHRPCHGAGDRAHRKTGPERRAARRVRGPERPGVARLGHRRDQRPLRRPDRSRQRGGGQGGLRVRRAAARPGTRGSPAAPGDPASQLRRRADHPDRGIAGGRRGGRAVPAGGDLRLPDLARRPISSRRSPRSVKIRRPGAVRVHQRRVRVRGDVGGDRRLCGRRPRLYRDGQPGPAVHGRGPVQRLRPRAADRDDGRQPRDRRADQHLERPQRLPCRSATAAGSSYTPRPTRKPSTCTCRPSGLPRKLSLPVMVCMDGFVLTHAFERLDIPGREQVDAFLPPLRAAAGARPGRSDLDRRDGRARGFHRGPLSRARHASIRRSS